MAKIQIGKKASVKSLREQVMDNGVEMSRNEAGVVISIKFPGMEVVDLTRQDLELVIGTLDSPEVKGSGPGSVFARSAVTEPDGSLIAKFSDAKRSRSIRFSREDCHEMATLLEGFVSKWEEYTEQLNAAMVEDQSDGE